MAILRDTTVNGNLTVNNKIYVGNRELVEGTPRIFQNKKIMAPDKAAGDSFGYAVAISGDYAIVGARYKNSEAGAAYIYRRTGTNTWDTGFKITPTTVQGSRANFGTSVSISGDYAIVGAPGEATGGINAGAAYVYRRTGTNTWGEEFKIMATVPQASGYFGESVSISGDYAIVGTKFESTGGNAAGAAYIYRKTGTNTWGEEFKIKATDPEANDRFGTSVAISGDYAIVGAIYETTGGTNAGAAYIYHRTSTNTWSSGFKIMATVPGANNYFGTSVSISGDYAIVGAYGEATGGDNAGAAYIYRRTNTNTWGEGVKIKATDPGANDKFGYSVAILGDYAIVGAYTKPTGGNSSGAAYVYRRTGTNAWGDVVKIMATNPGNIAYFGNSVSILGDYAIVGAFEEYTGSAFTGAAYLFKVCKCLEFK